MLKAQERRNCKIKRGGVYRDSAKVVNQGSKSAIYSIDLL